MDGDRTKRVWGSVYAEARGAVVSANHACETCVTALGVGGAALSLTDGSGLRETVYVTDPLSARLEEQQLALGEGPSVDVLASGSPVLIPDLEAADSQARWPAFVPAAVQAGAKAMFTFPLQSGAVRVGVLTLYRGGLGPLSFDGLGDAFVFADLVLALTLDGQAGIAETPRTWSPSDSVPHQVEVYQASGMVSVQLGVGVEEAFVRLRAYAFAHDQPLTDVARQVVARRLRFDLDLA